MTRKIKLSALTLLLSAFFLISCKKGEIFPEIPTTVTPAPTTPAKDTVVTPTKPVYYGRTLAVGTGSGNLVIDGSTLGVKCNDLIRVKGGKYSSITIRNINVGCDVTIQNDGLVEVVGNGDHILLSNVANLTLSGNGTEGIEKGFVSRDDPQHRALIITGAAQNLTVQYFSFKNIGDYVVYFNNSNGIYDGSAKSFSENIKFLNIDCSNTGTFLQMEGSVEGGTIKGLVRNIEIAYLNFKNSNCGHIVLIQNADGYNIHHNTVTDINSTNDNHNGIFTVKGSGSFHHNLIRNHEGNAIRAWVRSFGTTPKDVLIYNNTVVNSRRYSGFEAQAFDNEMIAGKTTYANVKVYNNICGDLNTAKYWVGVVVDVYDLKGGRCEVYNNKGFNFAAPSPKSFFVNMQGNVSVTETNNAYFASASAAGISDINTLQIQQ
ncbi:hypothetical protein ACSBL2_20100 [Pedobacter sp. AW31-3R]|uniref:hypothetical protein n=1 Tax=Pedobacter sp. AW31-3R TaxID=3445781 RepID=UPI003F9F6D0A